jgi:hypothetical protein
MTHNPVDMRVVIVGDGRRFSLGSGGPDCSRGVQRAVAPDLVVFGIAGSV